MRGRVLCLGLTCWCVRCSLRAHQRFLTVGILQRVAATRTVAEKERIQMRVDSGGFGTATGVLFLSPCLDTTCDLLMGIRMCASMAQALFCASSQAH